MIGLGRKRYEEIQSYNLDERKELWNNICVGEYNEDKFWDVVEDLCAQLDDEYDEGY